jgi:nucleoside-specific outer membrane channel protein Tsx
MVAQELPAHWTASELEMKPAKTIIAVPSVNPLTVSYFAPQLAELEGSDTVVGDGFGYPVAVSGGTAIVGAYEHGKEAGRAYVFTKSATGWKQSAELKGSDTVTNDYFGSAVAISGTTAIVGAFGHGKEAGRAYVFTKTAVGWAQTAELQGSDTVAGGWFGDSVAISGRTAIVAVPEHANVAGRAYVFAETAAGWKQVTELKGSDTTANGQLGTSVAISGNVAVFGAPFHADGGRAYVFIETKGIWKQAAELKGSDTVAPDQFGTSVAISGTTAVVGADEHADFAGRVYVFTKSATGWKQAAELNGSDTVANDSFGYSVAISGTTAVVGANGYAESAGRAYVFTKTASGWKQTAELKGSDTVAPDQFGTSVAISGTTVEVGAPTYAELNEKLDHAGRAYVFEA